MLFSRKPNPPLAVVEARDDNHALGVGLRQVLEYAEILDLPFACSSVEDASNDMEGTLMRQIIDSGFNAADDRHRFGDPHEKHLAYPHSSSDSRPLTAHAAI